MRLLREMPELLHLGDESMPHGGGVAGMPKNLGIFQGGNFLVYHVSGQIIATSHDRLAPKR